MVSVSQAFFTTMDRDVEEVLNEPDQFLNFLVNELKDLFWFEKNFLKVISRMQKASTSKKLNYLLAEFLAEASLNVVRLEQIFMFFGQLPKANKSNLQEEFLSDINNIILETKGDGLLRDNAFYWMINKMNKFKASSYHAVIELAVQLGNDEIIILLEENKKSRFTETYP